MTAEAAFIHPWSPWMMDEALERLLNSQTNGPTVPCGAMRGICNGPELKDCITCDEDKGEFLNEELRRCEGGCPEGTYLPPDADADPK